ncbi:TPA: ATP-binding protein [Yersinia enterocolitica]
MYISLAESESLDTIIKRSEVALRSFIADVLITKHKDASEFKTKLQAISISNELIYSKRFVAKLNNIIDKSTDVYNNINLCKKCLENGKYHNDVPYISELIDLILIFFNAHFSEKNITRGFSSVEEFHYCCIVFHQTRNNLSHPASRPITKQDANKVIYFIENIIISLDEKYFWYSAKDSIKLSIISYNAIKFKGKLKSHNLDSAGTSHRNLLCRDKEISELTVSLLGDSGRMRLAGSVVLYGYGGVGKTAITTEFLQRVARDKKDGKHENIEFILFFSSKDEYLRQNATTGEFYIDDAKKDFSNYEQLIALICSFLGVSDINLIEEEFKGGIIAIDNLENIEQEEKAKIIYLIKSLPRSIQFIVTSRNEEQCEEKINIREFKKDEIGVEFVEKIIDSQGLNLVISRDESLTLLDVSKGNALIIVQVLNALHRGVSNFASIMHSLESMRSKDSEIIANFMYKNTLDHALDYLNKEGYPVIDVVRIISLYDEKIELYSISKLAGIDVSISERLCNFLCERLVLNKVGEYYELNEFAKRFVFIKLLPDRFQLSNLLDKIKKHKERMKGKLLELDSTLKGNSVLHKNVTEWQPRNYIDKIVIAELFSLYGEAIRYVGNKNKSMYEKYLKEFNDHSLITNHPFVPLQRARLLKEGIRVFYQEDEDILTQVENAYEQALEAIEYDYRYLIDTVAYASLKMLFGIFLCENKKDYSRAVRFLEEAKSIFQIKINKPWFICCNYLSKSYKKMYQKTNDSAYRDHLYKTVRSVLSNHSEARRMDFSLEKYKRNYGYIIK